MKLQPVGRSLVVKVKQSEKKSIIIQSRDDSEPRPAEVIALGEKVEMPVSVGDVVLLVPYCGMKGVGGTDEEPYLLVGEKDVLGIIR